MNTLSDFDIQFLRACNISPAGIAVASIDKRPYPTDAEREIQNRQDKERFERKCAEYEKDKPTFPAGFTPAIPLPPHSAEVSEETAEYYFSLAERYGRPHRWVDNYSLDLGTFRLSIYRSGWERDIRDFTSIDQRTGLKRVYVIPKGWSGSLTYHLKQVADFNVKKLITGKFKSEHLDEAVREIESQLSQLDRHDKNKHTKDYPELAAFMHFEAWKKDHGYNQSTEGTQAG